MDNSDDRDMFDSDPVQPQEEDAEAEDYGDDQEEEPRSKQRRAAYDDDEDEDEDEEDEEDEDDDADGRKKKRAKLRHKKRSLVNRFVDLEAEVSDEEEEEEEEEEEGAEGFIEQQDDLDEDQSRRIHTRMDIARETNDMADPEEIARKLNARYKRNAVQYTGDMNEIPQRLLMPSVHDASLWQIRVKPGRERDIVFSLMRKAIDTEYSPKPLAILSAFQRDSLPGMIYVEARSSAHVQHAINGLVGVYPSRGITLVPIEEMASLLQIKKQEVTITPGTWVRIRKGKYQGDLAQVIEVDDNGEEIGCKLVPRIDLNPRDDGSVTAILDANKKRKKPIASASTVRPPQRLFNYEEVAKVYDRRQISKRSNATCVFQNETFREGFLEKDFKMSNLILEDINPTLDEITMFSRKIDADGQEAREGAVDLSLIAEASRKAAIASLQPGDHVEVFEGEQAGVQGVVEEIHQDVVIISAMGLDIEGQKIELPARSVRKKFKPGDHVKVMSGQNVDETGLVVSVVDNIVTFLSDLSMQEVSVFSRDLREAAEVGSSTNVVGAYELHDLVQLDAQNVGVIFKTERDTFRVLDQNGQVRVVTPRQITQRRDSNRAIATDSEGHELRVGDNVKEIEGENRKGQVLHIHQAFYAFLHNRDIVENGGVFVTRCRSLASLAPKGSILKPGQDLSKMNPAVGAPMGGMVGSGRGPRDRDIGLTVVIVKGQQKGYVGTIKDVNGNVARIELRTGNKIIMVDKEKLRERLPDGQLKPLTGRGSAAGFGGRGGRPGNGNGVGRGMPPPGGFGGMNGGMNGGKTPMWGASGKTPNPYTDGGKTPAWNASSKTPNPYAADSGKTPAWNASSRTPNPYAMDGGKTPAWNASSRTPNPYTSGWGGATPGRPSGGSSGNTWGGATPGRNTGSGGGGGWGGATPKPTSNSGGGGWGSSAGGWDSGAWSAPTPGALGAPTPSYNGAPTPGYLSAPTPGFGGPTPNYAPTPGVFAGGANAAPTPAASNDGGWGVSSSSESSNGQDWIYDSRLRDILKRMKIEIRGTHADNYLDGDYERRTGRIIAAVKSNANFESSATIQFDPSSSEPNGETRSILVKYITAVQPTMTNEQAVILRGSQTGVVVVCRGDPDEGMLVTVSPVGGSTVIQEEEKENLVALYPEM